MAVEIKGKNDLLEGIFKQAEYFPQKQAVKGLNNSLSYAELIDQINEMAYWLDQHKGDVVGLLMENGPAWVVIDLAAQAAGKVVVPLPLFFSEKQLSHILIDAGVSLLFTDNPTRLKQITTDHFDAKPVSFKSGLLQREAISLYQQPIIPTENSHLKGVGKVTYTSGTTGAPKGVCLSNEAIFAVTNALRERTEALASDCHLCLTPLSTLLENIAGIYVPLLAGGRVTVLSAAEVGLKGVSGLDIQQLFSALITHQATSAILIPQMLLAMVTAIDAGLPKPEKLRFLAVGGAPVSEKLLARAKACGLPLFQGYGLSECASVVAVNGSSDNRIGSVGRPLSHLQIDFSDAGEIRVKGKLFKGYLGGPNIDQNTFWSTGDIGYLDEAGYLWITGRKKNLFITSFGRNVSPEWLENEFSMHLAIQQIVVFGEARPWSTAIIVSPLLKGEGGIAKINQIIKQTNEQLPDYAQVKRWIAAKEPFSLQNGQLTGTARPRRKEIFAAYQNEIEQLYKSNGEENDNIF